MRSDPTDGRRFAPGVVALDEVRFVLVLGLVALVISSLPYSLGAALATEERVFGGFVYAVEDGYSYLAKMRQGAQGAWLFHIAYTAEPHAGALFFPFHLLLGKLAARVPIGDLTTRLVWTYHAARWVFGLGLLVIVYRFLAAFTDRVDVRRLAWSMVAFGGGLGWLLVALGQPDWLGSTPLDLILPEGFTFLVLYAFPHIALGRSLLLGGVLFLLRAWGQDADAVGRRPGTVWAALTGLLWLLMGLIVPFYVPVAWAVTGAGWLVLVLRHRRVMWREAGRAALAGLISAPVVAYSAWMFTTDPVYQTWSSQNLILSPHPLHYLAAYGLPLVLAIVALREAWRSERPQWLALAWVGVVPLLVYLPLNVQRRLVEGVQVPLSLLAALGAFTIANLRPVTFRLRSWLLLGALVILLSLTNVLLVAGNSLVLLDRPAPVFRQVAEVRALDWLAGRTASGDVILCAYETGNYLPARAAARVFVGHGPETVRFAEKKALVERFFDSTTPDDWRRDLLDAYGIDYVFWGPAEWRLGGFDPRTVFYLCPVYEAEGYAVLEVCP